ncbi:MAG: hypothetical protein AAF656_05050 [Planctomycetota bacterium]
MFHLDHDSAGPPSSETELRDAILGTLRNELTLDPRHKAVHVEPDLLKVDLTDARLATDVPPKRPRPAGQPVTGPDFAQLVVRGDPVRIDTADVDLKLEATGVGFDFDRDADDGAWLLMLRSAIDGHVDVAIGKDDLRALIETKVKQGADDHGVVIEKVELDLAEHGPRGVRLTAQISGHKPLGFLKPTFAVGLHGNLLVDDELVASLSDLKLEGDGIIMTLLTGMLGDKLKELETKEFPLAAFPLGEVRLRDVSINAADPVRVSAKFGSAD